MPIVDGPWADEYRDPTLKQQILTEYQLRYPDPAANPLTAPHLFDPLNPPPNYRYDPYYECWVKLS